MSVRSFHSVFMASAVAGAALGCYLVSLRVASERAALEEVENRIVLAQRDIRLLQTEIGTRGRLAQLERWNVRVLSLSAPSAEQILGDKFQLARLIQPERKLPVDAPVVLASAPARQPQQQLVEDNGAAATDDRTAGAPAAQLLHEAGVKIGERRTQPRNAPGRPAATASQTRPTPSKPAGTKAAPSQADSKPETKPETRAVASAKKAGDKGAKAAEGAVTRPVRTAKIDPLAPLAPDLPPAKGSRTNR